MARLRCGASKPRTKLEKGNFLGCGAYKPNLYPISLSCQFYLVQINLGVKCYIAGSLAMALRVRAVSLFWPCGVDELWVSLARSTNIHLVVFNSLGSKNGITWSTLFCSGI